MADSPHSGPEPRPLVGVAAQVGTAADVALTLRVAVTNAAALPRVLSVAVVGIDAAWTQGPVRTEVLAPGASAVVELPLHPPLGTLPASYPMVVAAQALDVATGRPSGAPTGSAESVLVVNPRSQLAVDLKPRQVRVIGSRRFTVELSNTGAVASTVQLQLKSTSHVAFSLQRDKVKIKPGATVSVRGRARVKRPTMVGPRSVHSFTLSARGSEAVKHVDGQVLQRSLVGPSVLKALCLLLVLAVWAGAAIVFIPALAEKVRSTSEETAAAEGPGGDSSEDGGDSGKDGGSDGGSEDEKGEAEPAKADEKKGLQLSGTVAGERPDGVAVRLEKTSLVDEQAEGAQGVGVPDDTLDGTGMRLASALLRSAPERAFRDRNVQTAADGSWAFPAVETPGYYLVSFSKPGYQTQRFVVDSSSAAAAEPLEVDLKAGEGSLSGRITDQDGKPEGGATVTITDGTNTAVTSSNSEGDVGAWSIEGLSTPSTYVVTATQHDMSSEARVVALAAGGTATADLKLAAGVTTLQGAVTGPALNGGTTGVGGITISVTDGKGDVRTATTLTQSPVGTYALPGLPAPGTYAVTASGMGFQAQTHRLRLKRGQAAATVDFDLASSTARLSGRVLTTNASGTWVGRPNAGLTLSNAEHSYKTMSTNGDSGKGQRSGDYEFTGVVPGDYILTTRYFGKKTVHQNVEVATGDSKPWNVRLGDDGSDGLTATSTIEGSAIDISTQLPLPATVCATADPCLTATVRQPKMPETTPETYDEYKTKFSPGANYLLPDPEIDPGAGLRPGLHTVTISAPGYEIGTVDVELGVATAATAPLAQLYPAPVVRGTITSPYSGTHPVSCVWILKGKKLIGDTTALGECNANPATSPCKTAVQQITEASAREEQWCALSDASGNYSVQVPTTGDYTLWVQPQAVDYLDAPPEHLHLDRGQVLPKDISIRRYGVLKLTVLRPGPGDAMVPVTDKVLDISHTRLFPDELKTDGLGQVEVTGLLPDQAYTIGGSYEVKGSGAGTPVLATMTGSLTRTVPIDGVVTARLRLTDPLPGVVGRVTSSVDDLQEPWTPQSLKNATVTLQIASSYDGDELTDSVRYETITVSSDELGCFGIASTTVPTRVAPCTNDRLRDLVWDPGTLSSGVPIATNRVKVLSINADGYLPLPVAQTQDVEFSTAGVTSFVLDPKPIDFAATIGIDPATPTSADIDLDWDKVQLRVDDKPAASGDVKLDVTATDDDATRGAVTLTDPSLPSGQVLPGTYRVTVDGLDDYQPVTADLVCRPGADRCLWKDAGDGILRIQELGSLKLRLQGATYPQSAGPVDLGDDHQVSLAIPPTQDVPLRSTTDDSIATFTRLAPGTYDADEYLLSTEVGGYTPGTSAGDTLAVRCPAPGGGTTSAIKIEPGTPTSCTVVLTKKLGSISGTLKGLMAPDGTAPEDLDDAGTVGPGEEPNYEHLGNVTLTLERCQDDATACDALDTSFPARTRVTALTTGTPRTGGTFTFAEVGPNERGLPEGDYLLSVKSGAVPAGYSRPQTPPRGTIVTLDGGQERANVDVPLYASTVDLVVTVTDDTGAPVSGADVVLHRRAMNLPRDSGKETVPVKSGNVYTFADVVPGWATVLVDAPGLTLTEQRVRILTNRAGQSQDLAMPVQRPRGAATGVVTTTAPDTGSTAVRGAAVTLTCAEDDGPDDAFCPDDEPAIDLDGTPLSTTTDTDGRFTFTNVAVGRYVVTYGKRGYGAAAPVEVDITASDPSAPVPVTVTTVPLSGNGRQVTVTLTSSHDDPDGVLAATTVTVTGRPGTPGTFTSTVQRAADGTYAVTFDNLRWGCYDVTLTTPSAWRGAITGPTGSPTQDDLECGDADLVVPDTTGGDIALAYGLSSGLLQWSLETVQKPAGHLRPTTVLDIDQTDGSYETQVTVDDPLVTTGKLFVPAGTYQITASVPDDDADYWTVDQPAPVTVADGEDGELRMARFTETFFTIVVSVAGLTDPASNDEAEIRYLAGTGQSGVAPADNSKTTVNGTTTLSLPRGNWQIRGAWPAGPGNVYINVTTDGDHQVVIQPFNSGLVAPAAPTAEGASTPPTTAPSAPEPAPSSTPPSPTATPTP
ncbi:MULTISPECIES: carboxypeptidase regulatory-like domain-containing protein [unclassified Nocardioides]|uniref:carboxypeptidase regulatory-like domain-containing protein n=1 Tax=unclassified Nocardioides TaxID=2615069 RepID=UPI003014E70E